MVDAIRVWLAIFLYSRKSFVSIFRHRVVKINDIYRLIYMSKQKTEDDWERILESQRLFMQRRDRQKPAATVVRIPPVEKDVIELETPLDKIHMNDTASATHQKFMSAKAEVLAGQDTDESKNNKNKSSSSISRPPVETDVIDVISDIVEREINPSIYKPPKFSTGVGGFPSVFKRSNGPLLSKKHRNKLSSKTSRTKSKFSKMLEKERRNQSEITATNAVDDVEKQEIHQENLQRLASMTKAEIEQARNDLMSSMSPSLLALFKKRQEIKMQRVQQQHQTKEQQKKLPLQSSTSKNKDTVKQTYGPSNGDATINSSNNSVGSRNIEESRKIESDTKKIFPSFVETNKDIYTEINAEDDLDQAVIKYLPDLEKEKLSWTGKVGAQPKSKSKLLYKVQPRFDLKGVRVVLSSTSYNGGEVSTDKKNDTKIVKQNNDDVRQVGEQEGEIYGLYHHGEDPDEPGYTFSELLHLSRSVVTAQRLTALRAVSYILEKRRGKLFLQHTLVSSLRKNSNDLESQPCPATLPPKLADILLMGLNSNVSSVIQYSIGAIHYWLVPDKFIDTNKANPQYRRYELYPHVSIAQDVDPSIKSTPVTDPFGDDIISPKSENKKDDEMTEEGKLAKLKKEDPIRWLLRNGIMATYTRILTSEEDFPVEVYKHALATVTYMSSHSKVVAFQIWQASDMIKVVRHRFMEGNDKSHGYALASHAIRLLRTLSQSNFVIASDIVTSGISESIKRYFVGPELFATNSPQKYCDWEACVVEALQLWRTCLLYGLDQDSVQNMVGSIRSIIKNCENNEMFSHKFSKLVERFLYSIYSAYCVSIHQSKRDVKHISESVYNEMKVYVTEALNAIRLLSSRSNDSNDKFPSVYVKLSGPLHFVATYLNLGAFNKELYGKICDVISTNILGSNDTCNPSLYFDNLLKSMMRAKSNGNDTYFIDSLHGLVRCLEALLKNEEMNKNLKFDKSAHSKFLSSILKFITGYFLTEDSPTATKHQIVWSGLTPYDNRAFILFLLNSIVYVRKLHSLNNIENTEKMNKTLDILSDATLLLISNILPGDEYVFMNSINLFLTICSERKRIDTGSISIDDINALKIYFSSFAGSRVVQDHSARLFLLQSTSIASDKTFSIIPRSHGQIPSVLPLPAHWLWIPLTLDGGAREEVFLNSIHFVSSLELSGYFDRPSVRFQLTVPARLFCILQIFLCDDSSLAFKNQSIPNIQRVIDNLLQGSNIMQVVKVCGGDSTEALIKSLINVYFQSSFGSPLLSQILLYVCEWKKMRKFLWRQGIKHGMLYLLESVFKKSGRVNTDNDNMDASFKISGEEDDHDMVDLYCESIISASIDKERSPELFNSVLQRIKTHALKSSEWMRNSWKERLGAQFCAW
eukprot:g9217.t1